MLLKRFALSDEYPASANRCAPRIVKKHLVEIAHAE